MLERLKLQNVGPAPEMELDFAQRVNLITGDNGLGKSFLLDVAWWALTRRWPQEVNRRMTSGLPARPTDRKRPATITLGVTGKTKTINYISTYAARDEAWTGKAGRPWNPGLVIYAHADGSFSVWDPARNYWKKKGDVDIQERLAAYVFTPAEVWNGIKADVDGTPPICYMLTWSWAEHRLAAVQLGEEPTTQVVMLFDEVESHLHPRWQRVILKALRDLVGVLHDQASVQLIVATHSPLVLASAEPWFDPKKDAWFDIDLEGKPPRVQLRKRTYTPRGAAGYWLTSEAFDLATDRGSVEAERAILQARALLQEPTPQLAEVMKAHAALRAVLPDVDRFWVRWNAFVEQSGGQP